METIGVVCPQCRSRLQVKNEPGIEDKILRCPVCGHRAKVCEYQRKNEVKDEKPDTACTDPGQIRVIPTGQICDLRIGTQVLGRLAESRKADIQIGSDTYKDPFMSRAHVQINVVQTAEGVQHELVEIGSKNIIQLNGSDINRGDKILLKFGDRLRFGRTDVVFEPSDDEATRLG